MKLEEIDIKWRNFKNKHISKNLEYNLKITNGGFEVNVTKNKQIWTKAQQNYLDVRFNKIDCRLDSIERKMSEYDKRWEENDKRWEANDRRWDKQEAFNQQILTIVNEIKTLLLEHISMHDVKK